MGSNVDHNWTDERVESLTRLHTEGQSAGQIARALGGVSRNAVIGKIHRLKLPRPDPRSIWRLHGAPDRAARAKKPCPAVRGSPEHKKREAKVAVLRAALISGGHPGDTFTTVGRPFMDRRRASQCAYPVAGERADTLACCAPGEVKTDGSAPYCAAHRAIMFVTPQTNTKDLERDVRRRFAA